jgi:hypothetical protein
MCRRYQSCCISIRLGIVKEWVRLELVRNVPDWDRFSEFQVEIGQEKVR